MKADKLQSDILQQELIEVFQLYIEYSQKSFTQNFEALTLMKFMPFTS